MKQVLTAWPDMLRVAGSLVTNQVRAYDLLRMFGREGHPTPQPVSGLRPLRDPDAPDLDDDDDGTDE